MGIGTQQPIVRYLHSRAIVYSQLTSNQISLRATLEHKMKIFVLILKIYVQYDTYDIKEGSKSKTNFYINHSIKTKLSEIIWALKAIVFTKNELFWTDRRTDR